jgi:hypothetical protein
MVIVEVCAMKVSIVEMAMVEVSGIDVSTMKVTSTDMTSMKVTSADMAATAVAATAMAAVAHLHGLGPISIAQQVCCGGSFPLFHVKLQRVVFCSGRFRPHPQDCGSHRSKHPATAIHMVALLGGEKSQLSPKLLNGSDVALGFQFSL